MSNFKSAERIAYFFIDRLLLIGYHALCSKISLACGISYLIFTGSLTVRFDLSDYKLLVIGQVKSDSFGVKIAKLSYKYGLLRTNQKQAYCY